ncbi:hypothetical protein C8R44DRAFT_864961 [Mycena epipterygia]|nr:hypothetical protein C8R44DRAFT_864961 [Mycena epipterygia]
MHRSLSLPEIVGHIFAQVREPPYDARDTHSLAALARTCTAFLDSALNYLWESQDTIANILGCFPAGVVRKVANQDGSTIDCCALRSMSPTDWERPLFYSFRVKRLDMWQRATWLARTSLSESICSNWPGGHLFPNLEALALRLGYEDENPVRTTHWIDFLFSPRIKELDLDFGPSVALLSEVVPTLTAQYTSVLTCARITTGLDEQYDESAYRSVSAFVLNLRRVESLTAEDLDREALEYLGSLSTLKLLQLVAARMPFRPVDNTTSPPHIYSFLETLLLDSTTFECVIAFIDVFHNCPLQTLWIESLYDVPTGDAYKRLYSALATNCRSQSLRTINIDSDSPIDENSDRTMNAITGDVLSTLFCFANLVHVWLNPSCGFDLSDADISDLACAWPLIERLELINGSSNISSSVTLYGLYAFAQHCPNLEVLGINFDATGLAEWDTVARDASQTRLKLIDIGASAIDDTGRVTIFLSAVFPRASINFDYWNPPDELDGEEAQYFRRWEEVQRLVTGIEENGC